MFSRDLERRIVEVEMELTVAKSQGYLKNQLKQSGISSGKQLLAVIGIYTGFGGHLRRNMIRGSWVPNGQSLYSFCLGHGFFVFLKHTYNDMP